MIVVQKTLTISVQAAFVEHDQVIQALPVDGSNYPFYIATLPRRTWRRQHLLTTHRLHLLHKLMTEDSSSVPQTNSLVRWPRGMPLAVAERSILQSDGP